MMHGFLNAPFGRSQLHTSLGVLLMMVGTSSVVSAGPAATGFASEWTQIANNIQLGAIASTETKSLATQAQILSAEVEQIKTLTSTYQTMLENALRLPDSFLRDTMEPIIRLRSVAEQTGALVGEATALDEFLTSDLITDPLFDNTGLKATDISGRYNDWNAQWLQTLEGSLRGAGLSLEDVATEGELLQSLNARLGNEGGHMQALQLANQLSGSMARQMTDLRGLTALQVEQNGVAWARVLADMDRQEAERREAEINLQSSRKRAEQALSEGRGINEILGLGQ
jgi:P-type conjugative transfer protein TrbJ